MTGFLRAFDAHFNLLLTDVDEEYGNRNKFAAAQSQQSLSQQQQYFSRHQNRNDSGGSASGGGGMRTMSSSSSSSSSTVSEGGKSHSDKARSRVPTLKRHLPQLLIRGDNVISLSRRTLQVYDPPVTRQLIYTSDRLLYHLLTNQSCSYGRMREMLGGVTRSNLAPRDDTSVQNEQQQRQPQQQQQQQHRPPPLPPPLPPTYLHQLHQQQHQQHQQQQYQQYQQQQQQQHQQHQQHQQEQEQQQQPQKRQLEEKEAGEDMIDWGKMNEESDADVDRYFET